MLIFWNSKFLGSWYKQNYKIKKEKVKLNNPTFELEV